MDAHDFGTEMFEATSDVGDVAAAEIVRRDAKEYEVRRGPAHLHRPDRDRRARLASRRAELLEATGARARAPGYALYALMITDIVAKGTELLVAGDAAPVERAFGVDADDGVLDLPGVMSRKKQVAPKLLAAV